MSTKSHLIIIIDRLEYYLTKDLERTIYGTGDACYLVLFDRLFDCVKARKEHDYKPYLDVYELLESYGYDKEFIKKFRSRICCVNNIDADDENISSRENMIKLIDILECYITKNLEKNIYGSGEKYYPAIYDRFVECINARKEINYMPNQSVKKLLEGHGYDEEFISKFLSKVELQLNHMI